MEFYNQNKKFNDFKIFLLAIVLVLVCFLGYVFHSVFFFGQFIFLILLVVNPLLFGYLSKRSIMSFIVGFLSLFMMILYRLPFSSYYPDQWIADSATLLPGAFLLGVSGFFAAYQTKNKSNQIFCYGLAVLSILMAIAFYLVIYF
ncbi:hypothetical protein MmiHf6_14930 [Methanimicrococcus hongohii]|uniref:Uncharacterized protein n=1 Tax=Methanimicrococcus hongohii TaxID=3028295 RepID=A0AA96V0N9_9EURY|nr:hypothetical protein [Methanimicrococcus sp. Hf6]WNY24164.1 hypothetical protein MmiHf6_14930 [Methanimicrococcus sp. Hf6]